MSDEERVADFRPRRGGRGDEDYAPPDCPVIPLGQNDGRYWFLSPSGELRSLGFRELRSDAGQASLFDGAPSYLNARWPKYDKDGRVIENDFNPKKTHFGLITMAASAGQWDPETPVRGRGVWRLPDGGMLCHAGDRLVRADGSEGP